MSREEAPSVCTVLCIEADPDMFELIRLILQMASSVQVLRATCAREALRGVYEHRPDLILLDLNLPDFSSEELLRRLKVDRWTRQIPVIVLGTQFSARLLEMGATWCLQTPFHVDDFLVAVEAAANTK